MEQIPNTEIRKPKTQRRNNKYENRDPHTGSRTPKIELVASGWLADCLAGWMDEWMAGWLSGGLSGLLSGWLNGDPTFFTPSSLSQTPYHATCGFIGKPLSLSLFHESISGCLQFHQKRCAHAHRVERAIEYMTLSFDTAVGARTVDTANTN